MKLVGGRTTRGNDGPTRVDDRFGGPDQPRHAIHIGVPIQLVLHPMRRADRMIYRQTEQSHHHVEVTTQQQIRVQRCGRAATGLIAARILEQIQLGEIRDTREG